MSKVTPVVGAVKKGLTFNGTKLDTPASPTAPQINISDPQSIANALTTSTNQANAANNQRYGQGLGVLTGGYQQAMQNAQQFGNTSRQNLNTQLQNNLGQVAQNSVSRGLGNTTIQDSMKAQAQRTYDQSMTGVNEAVAQQQAGLLTGGAGAVSNWIGQRNDQAPDLGQYTGLIQQALSAPKPGQQSVARIQNGSMSGNSWNDPGNPQAYPTTMTGQNPTATIGPNGAMNYIPAPSGVNMNGNMGSIQSAIGGVNAGALNNNYQWPMGRTQVSTL